MNEDVKVDMVEFGFQEVGECQLNGNLTSGVSFIVNDLRNDRVIYAYPVNGGVTFRKVKTICQQRSRFTVYMLSKELVVVERREHGRKIRDDHAPSVWAAHYRDKADHQPLACRQKAG